MGCGGFPVESDKDNSFTVTDELCIRGNLRERVGHAIVGAALGYAQSWVNPTYLLSLGNDMNHARKNNSADLAEVIWWMTMTAGYSFGVSNHIRDMAANPHDWTNYIPLVTNAVGFGLTYVGIKAREDQDE